MSQNIDITQKFLKVPPEFSIDLFMCVLEFVEKHTLFRSRLISRWCNLFVCGILFGNAFEYFKAGDLIFIYTCRFSFVEIISNYDYLRLVGIHLCWKNPKEELLNKNFFRSVEPVKLLKRMDFEQFIFNIHGGIEFVKEMHGGTFCKENIDYYTKSLKYILSNCEKLNTIIISISMMGDQKYCKEMNVFEDEEFSLHLAKKLKLVNLSYFWYKLPNIFKFVKHIEKVSLFLLSNSFN